MRRAAGADGPVDDLAKAEATTILRKLISRIEVHPGEARGETHVSVVWSVEEIFNPSINSAGNRTFR